MSIPKPNPKATDLGRLLTKSEAAAWLGISKLSLQWQSERYGIPHVKLGRVIRYRLADLDAYKKKYMSLSHDSLLSGKKAAEYAGVSTTTLYKAAEKGVVKHITRGCKRFYRVADLDEYAHARSAYTKQRAQPYSKAYSAYAKFYKIVNKLYFRPIRLKQKNPIELREHVRQLVDACGKLDAALEEWGAKAAWPGATA